MDLMHHEDRTLGWIGVFVFVVLLASALVIALNRDNGQEVAAAAQVAAPPISQPGNL